ncbi:MAG: ribosome-associated translation inhibitor RaiA [Anaerolineales bacterium]|jgi:putative sigma-54 modulation protein
MTLDITVKGKDMDVTPQLEEYVRKKVAKLDRHLDNLEKVHVELTYMKGARSSSDRQVAQLTARGPTILLRAEERSEDMFASVDKALEKLTRRLDRYKGKHYRGRGDGTSTAEAADETASEEGLPAEGVIARRKRFEIIPMDESEAIEQMLLLGHESFFVFLNVHTEHINILYRRRDGTYGIIEPELR